MEERIHSNNNFWINEFKNVTELFQKYLELYVKSFMIYLGVTAALLKFSLDSQATVQLKNVLVFFGISFSLLYLLSILFALKILNILKRRRKKALEVLNENLESEFVSGLWGSIIFFIIVIIIIVGWIIIARS